MRPKIPWMLQVSGVPKEGVLAEQEVLPCSQPGRSSFAGEVQLPLLLSWSLWLPHSWKTSSGPRKAEHLLPTGLSKLNLLSGLGSSASLIIHLGFDYQST